MLERALTFSRGSSKKDSFDTDIFVKIRPMEVSLMMQFDIENLSDRSGLKPRELLEWQEELLIADK